MNYTESTCSDYLHRDGEEKQPEPPDIPFDIFWVYDWNIIDGNFWP